jgi:hypothetical protein
VPRTRWIIGLVTGATAVALVALALGLAPFHDRNAQGSQSAGELSAALLPATATIAGNAPGLPVPRSFLGISTEYSTLPFWEQRLAVVERVLAQIHSSGDGPLVLRIGGDSADHAFWEASRREVPEWAYELDPRWLAETRQLVSDTGARVILDLNLITATPQTASLWAQTAEAQFPRGSILGFEIGNEPDIYSRDDWLDALKGPRGLNKLLPQRISAAQYARDFVDYARVIRRFAPDARLFGPALANPTVHYFWIRALLRGPHLGLAMITGHRYPYSACAFPGTRTFATIGRVLSERATAGIAQLLRPAIRTAHEYGLPFRLTELNSVTCGGKPGVSDTFATALWAPDVLFELMRAGVDGVNVHIRASTSNAAFMITTQGLLARPLLYGLITFARMIGPEARLVGVQLRAPAVAHVKAWAVRVSGTTLRLLVIDKGNIGVRVALRLPARGPAAVQRLLAASASARTGVTLAGQYLDSAGRWVGRPRSEFLRPGRHGYELVVPRQTVALLTVRLRPAITPTR